MMTYRFRRCIMKAAIFAAFSVMATPAVSQETGSLPKGPITLVVPFAAGGATDVVSRLIAQKLGERISRTVVVENLGGGGGAIGAAKVARAAADGHTLLMGTIATHVINPLTTPKLAYDPQRDFTPVSLIVTVPNVLLVNNKIKAKSVDELLSLLKNQPGKLSYGSSGMGTPPHLSGELLKSLTNVNMTHVPYKGGGPAITDLIAGHIPILFDVLSGAASHIRAGSVRALAVTTRERVASFPGIPTMAESGVSDYDTWTWNAIFAPAGTPRPVVENLSNALQAVVKDPQVQARLKEISATPVGSTPEALAQLVDQETKKWRPIIDSIESFKKD